MLGAPPESLLLQRGSRGKGTAAPLPVHPKSPLNRSTQAFAPLRTFSVDDAEHFLHNHHASVASLRLLLTFAPERRLASLRNRCSPSPECPLVLQIPAQGVSWARFLHWQGLRRRMNLGPSFLPSCRPRHLCAATRRLGFGCSSLCNRVAQTCSARDQWSQRFARRPSFGSSGHAPPKFAFVVCNQCQPGSHGMRSDPEIVVSDHLALRFQLGTNRSVRFGRRFRQRERGQPMHKLAQSLERLNPLRASNFGPMTSTSARMNAYCRYCAVQHGRFVDGYVASSPRAAVRSGTGMV